MAAMENVNWDEVDCPKHGRCRVICISWRMQWYKCMGCFEEEILKAKKEGRKAPAIYD